MGSSGAMILFNEGFPTHKSKLCYDHLQRRLLLLNYYMYLYYMYSARVKVVQLCDDIY